MPVSWTKARPRRTSKQLAEQIDFVGGALEAKAAEDFTTASARVLKKDIDLGFTLLADMLQHPAFHKHEFERIRSQILGEMASDNDDPGHVAMKAFNQLVFHGHPYRWPFNGTEETLNKITHADVLRLLREGILSEPGDSDHRRRRDDGTGHGIGADPFRSLEKSRAARTQHEEAAPSIEKKTVQLIEKDLTQSNVILGHGGISRANPDFYSVTVMNYILGAGGFSSRLMDSIRDKQGLAYGIMSHFDARLMPGSFWVNFQTRTEATNQAITASCPKSSPSVKRRCPIRSCPRPNHF